MFGIGYGFLNVLLLSSQKSEMNLTDPSFFGMMNVGAVIKGIAAKSRWVTKGSTEQGFELSASWSS